MKADPFALKETIFFFYERSIEEVRHIMRHGDT